MRHASGHGVEGGQQDRPLTHSRALERLEEPARGAAALVEAPGRVGRQSEPMQARSGLLLAQPAFWAGIAACCLALAGALLEGAGWPLLAAAGALAVWLTAVVLAPGPRTLVVQAAALGTGAVLLALAGGGVTHPAISAVLWPLAGLVAGGNRLGQGLAVTLAAALAAGGLGPVFAGGAPLVSPQWGAGLGLGIAAILALGAILGATLAASSGGQSPGDAAIGDTKPAPVGPAAPLPATVDRALALAALEEAERARADATARARFIAEMSHEIRTPLNAILGFSDTMREGVFGPLPDRYRDYAGLIHQSGAHLLELVSDLLDISKLEAGRYRVALEPLDLAELVTGAVQMAVGSAAAQDVQVRVETGAPVPALGDARAVRQMVLNLISNAVKFTPSGGTVRVRTLEGADGPRIEIEDTGVGMSAEQLARVGQPWAGGEEDGKGLRGSGLGLTLVQKLAQLQGGRLLLASQPGAGTLAVIELKPQPLAS
jgi:signal transduction histidine kinase